MTVTARRAVLLAGASFLIPLSSGAQVADSLTLDTVVLRAGQPRVASDVPQSVTVIDEEELTGIEPATIGDVLDVVPGVSGVGSSSFFGQSFNIRGVGEGIAASESSIVQLLDGEQKYYESYRQGSLFVEPDFLKRVEVLRGPGSSTLYGSGALGGVIAMETIEPEDLLTDGRNVAGRAKLGFASNPDTAFGSAAIAWRASERTTALAAFALRDLGDSTDPDGDRLIRSNSLAPNLLLKLNHDLNDEHRLRFSYVGLRADGDDQDFNQQEGPQIGLFPGFPGWGVGDILTVDHTARAVWEYDPVNNPLIDLAVTLSYNDTLKRTEQGDDPDEPIMPSMLGERSYELWKLKAVNVADLSSGEVEHYLTFGAEISAQDRTSTVPSSSHPEATTDRQAVYALSELTMGPLTINTGLRIEHQRTTPAGSVTATDEKVSDTAIEPQIAAIYRLNDNWSVFGSLARVERLPTADELYDSFMGGAPSAGLKSERGVNTEIGLSWRGRDLFGAGDEAAVKVTLFHNDITDRITRTNAPVPTPAYVNVAEVTLKGGEIEASYANGPLSLTAGLSMVDGEDGDGGVVDSLPNDRIGIGAAWQASPAWKVGGVSTFAAGREKADGTERGGFAVHDLFALWTPQQGALEGVQMRFGIDNTFDKTYVPATWTTGPAPGRNFSVSLTRAF
ncbi:TonB-dependent receptor [Paracoccus sp. Z118]|uniref:TonB-dependent receptor domain-containing protein n=1 Tax=Paracoccus sp. Z118 TaxID=2851017 RepID=UPI001C2BBD38|nr:TonB-dependent receptor [Paracoccus sp. Z118]MBV0892696.1 TonB-dependent receptor [Paracoccus sp. Z118]